MEYPRVKENPGSTFRLTLGIQQTPGEVGTADALEFQGLSMRNES